jgi:DNA repair ATPase RecN
MDNLKDVVGSEKSDFERFMEKIPGVSGYKDKERRRETDKIVRETLAKRYDEEWNRISEIQRLLIKKGDLSSVSDLESAAIKLRQFADRIKTASYGYAGLLDNIKVDEAALDKLYNYDNSLFDLADAIKEAVSNVEAATESGEGLADAIQTLTRVAQDSVTAFNKRSEVITGTGN